MLNITNHTESQLADTISAKQKSKPKTNDVGNLHRQAIEKEGGEDNADNQCG